MVLEVKNNNIHFSIERFESVMLSAGVSWEQINKELEYDAESMLKNKTRQPMPNIVNKACTVIGLDNSDYVMMRSNNYKLKKSEPMLPENKKRGRKSKYTKEEINIALELLEISTYEEVAETTGIPVSYLSKLVTKGNKENSILKNKNIKYSEEEKHNALKLLETHTYAEVSKITGIPEKYLSHLVTKRNKENGTTVNRKYSEEERYNAIKLLESHTYKEVSEITGISLATLYNMNKKYKEEEKMAVSNEEKKSVMKNSITEEKVDKNEKETNTLDSHKKYPKYHNNKNNRQNPNFMLDMFERYDRMSDDELNISLEYINDIIEFRKRKNDKINKLLQR